MTSHAGWREEGEHITRIQPTQVRLIRQVADGHVLLRQHCVRVFQTISNKHSPHKPGVFWEPDVEIVEEKRKLETEDKTMTLKQRTTESELSKQCLYLNGGILLPKEQQTPSVIEGLLRLARRTTGSLSPRQLPKKCETAARAAAHRRFVPKETPPICPSLSGYDPTGDCNDIFVS